MSAIHRRVTVYESGHRKEPILPKAQFRDLIEKLGLDLDRNAKADLRVTRRDLKKGNGAAFKPRSTL